MHQILDSVRTLQTSVFDSQGADVSIRQDIIIVALQVVISSIKKSSNSQEDFNRKYIVYIPVVCLFY